MPAVLSLGGVNPDKIPATSVFHALRNQAEPASVPSNWRTWGTLTDSEVYPGQCYGRAYGFLDGQNQQAQRHHAPSPVAGAVVVHGTLQTRDLLGTERWFWHAWVELPDDVVFDGVVQQFYTGASYTLLARPEVLATYEWAAAKRLREYRRHVGPWYFAEGSALSKVLGDHETKNVGQPCPACGEPWPCQTSDVIRAVVRLQADDSGAPTTLRQLLRIGELEDVVPALQRAGWPE